MRCSGNGIGIAEASEEVEVIIHGRGAEEELVRGKELSYTAETAAKDMSGGAKSVRPEARRDAGMQKQGVDAVVDCAKHSLHAAIMR